MARRNNSKQSDSSRRMHNASNGTNVSSELLRSAASLPFSQTIGSKPTARNNLAVPGVMAIEYAPTVGGSVLDPVNQAANQIFSFTVHANSRNTKYNAPDELLLIIAAAQLYAGIAFGVRAYGVIKHYEQQNYYLPDGVIEAMGFNPDDLRSNLSKMWFDLNNFVERAKQIWVPTDIPLFERWFWMNSNIYEDAESVKSQKYLFVPTLFYYFSDMTTEHPETHLLPYQWLIKNSSGERQLRKWSDFTNMINLMFWQLLNSEDRGIIFGDILKAYGEGNIFSMQPISSEYVVNPIFDERVLSQIENATAAKIKPTGIYHNPNQGNRIYEEWTVEDDTDPETIMLPGTGVLNFHTKSTPSPDDIISATRFMALGVSILPQINATPIIMPTTCGSEIIQCFSMYTRQIGTGAYLRSEYTSMQPYNLESGGTATISMDWHRWIAFDWAPWIYFEQQEDIIAWWNNTKPTSDYDATPWDAIGDYDNYTYVNINNLQQIHESYMYHLFGIPKF
nr:capsid protein [Rat picobirnavirus]